MKANKITTIIISSAVLICLALLFKATLTGTSQVYLPSELPNQDLQRVRLAGRVTNDKVNYQVEPELKLEFFIKDPKNDNEKTVAVVYEGIKPDMFASGRDVILDGNFKNGIFEAVTLLTQCPSKYEPPKPGESYSKENQT